MSELLADEVGEDWETRSRYLQAMVNCVTMPDSRATFLVTPREVVPSKLFGYMVPIFCASCHVKGGLVPQENMTFAFWLCRNCEKYGEIEGHYMEPDPQFWARVELEEINTYGRRLTETERLTVAQADASPLATLIQEGS